MKTYRQPLSTVLFCSLLSFLVIVLVGLPWLPDYYASIGSLAILLVLTYIAVFAFLFFFFLVLLKRSAYRVGEKEITVVKRGLFQSRRISLYYERDRVTIEISENFLLDFFFESKISIFDGDGNKILSLAMNKDESDSLSESAIERKKSENLRYITKYGVDCSNPQNYDLIIDTTDISPEQVSEIIISKIG